MLYHDSIRLSLPAGDEVQTYVQSQPSNGRQNGLLLHGNPATMLDWEGIVPLLADVANVAAIDMPGFGRSLRANSDPEGINLNRLADCVIAIADALNGTEPFFIAGHSHGGGVAQIAAAKYPDRVAGIVLISTLSARRHSTYRFLSLPGAEFALQLAGYVIASPPLRRVGKSIMRRVMNNIWSPQFVSNEQLERELSLFSLRPEILVSMVHVAQGQPCRQLAQSVSQIRCPVLLIHSEEDTLVPVQFANSLHKLIVNAGGQSEIQVLSGAGHAVLSCQTTEVADCITSFLARLQS